jgi:hypothetical protein
MHRRRRRWIVQNASLSSECGLIVEDRSLFCAGLPSTFPATCGQFFSRICRVQIPQALVPVIPEVCRSEEPEVAPCVRLPGGRLLDGYILGRIQPKLQAQAARRVEFVRQGRHSCARICSLQLHCSRCHYPPSDRAPTVRGALITAATAGPIVVSTPTSAGLRCRGSAGFASPTHSQDLQGTRKGAIGVSINQIEPAHRGCFPHATDYAWSVE